MSAVPQGKRVLSGMRPTGALHLGNYHGALRNWVELQYQYECYFFIADWHALTTGYEDTTGLPQAVHEVMIDWLAAGLNPGVATLFVQSHVPEHAELHLLLSMITPLSWLERVPTYKDQQEQLKEKDLATYGFLGYPLLQSADILLYRPAFVPVGEDQVAHVEITREIARRFNHLYGREQDFEQKAERAIKELGGRNITLYRQLRRRFQESGDLAALERARVLVESNTRITVADRERLLGYLEGSYVSILPEPQVLLTASPRVPGLDGRKMSKSYGNTIQMREDPDAVVAKLKTMQTDPARVRRTDPGDPEKCPVWDLHKLYSDEPTRQWVDQGCRTAGIGCLDCKQPLIERIVEEVNGMRKRAQEFQENPDMVATILTEGGEKARAAARATLDVVRRAMHLRPQRFITADDGEAGSQDRCLQPAAGCSAAGAVARAGRDAIRRSQRRAHDAIAARSVYPAAGTGDIPRGVRRPARSAALPNPAAERRYPQHPDRRDHAPVHPVHRADAGSAAGAGRRVPGDGRNAGRDQIAHAAAAAARGGRQRRRRSACRAGAPAAGVRALQTCGGGYRCHAAAGA
jgi:tryptophanyl-tRNA synthetase